MEKSLLESMHYCYLTTKNILGLKKNTKEMNFQIRKFMFFLVHPTMHLLGREYTQWFKSMRKMGLLQMVGNNHEGP